MSTTDADLIKSLIRRIQALESQNEEDGPVEQNNYLNDVVTAQDIILFYPHEFMRCGVTYLADNETIDNQKTTFGDTATATDTVLIYPHTYKMCGLFFVGDGVYI